MTIVLEPRYVTGLHVAVLAGVKLATEPFRKYASDRLAAILIYSPDKPTGHMLSAE